MSITTFLNEENLKVLWDVIIDADILKFQPKIYQEKIFQIFLVNLKGFYEVERKKTNNLIELNKKYILLVLNHIKQTAINPQPNKIKILDEIPKPQVEKQLITYEEIQNDRKSHFEKDLNKKRQEFENTMTIKAPPVPEFSDKYEDTPIEEMDKIIKEMTAKRNYDVEQINRNNIYKQQTSQVDNWLKPQETSLKSEKISNNNNNTNTNTNTNINKKNVSWGENQTKEIKLEIEEYNEEIENIDDNIFKKFKKIEIINENKNNEINNLKINELENEVKNINEKINVMSENISMILSLLQKKSEN